ncbi:flagellar hook-length control protein FliK [Pseudomonas sp. 21LCFQ010]|uniref:flagellar hook-length control protein FliK n=1 Tax=Pseudomonas sp. 21LCFQ010 TaxID=2957506 RepID=UPI002097ABC8|nr:flagellar hook-length control protein FliK [Pseudomonas sp. 21LCFQ010]MCO8163402.1 flagellar hook-length control protein FliK [Pseudomonas sp. 21LCFQ010]
MPLAPDVFLQANVAAPAKTGAVSNSFKPAETSKADASSFSDVYAQQSRDKPAVEHDIPARPARDKPAADKDKAVATKDKPAAVGKDKPDTADKAKSEPDKVAGSGNSLPVQAKGQTADADDQSADPSEAVEQLVGLPTLIQIPVEVPTEAPVDNSLSADAAIDGLQQSQLAASPLAAVPAATPAAVEEAFNPEADPLDGLHALQFALESAGGKSRAAAPVATHQAGQAQANPDLNSDDTRAQNVVNNLASLNGDPAAQDGSTESSDQSFTAVLGDGLKDVKSAAGDTRVDNFAERLAALSQAAQPARPVTAPVASPLGQPLAMHQSGWTEGIVDRVMYLSSQNLKSAEIKLEPAELGRLDIRVNMAPDQQTQVTFASAHLGVRDALESQVARLRESFSQQGLGQVDVNVSDQSQQQAQQQAQEQASRAQRGGRGSMAQDDVEDEVAPAAAAAVSQPAQRILGSSEIDYYA